MASNLPLPTPSISFVFGYVPCTIRCTLAEIFTFILSNKSDLFMTQSHFPFGLFQNSVVFSNL